MSQEVRSKPLSRSVTALLVLAVLTAFLPHRERALLLTNSDLAGVLASQTLAGNSFAAPGLYGSFNRDLWDDWWPSATDRPTLRRERFAPGRRSMVPAMPELALAVPQSGAQPGIIPLGGTVPPAAPVFSGAGPNPGAPGGGGPGPIGSLPGGGGGGGGGGGSITTPPNPIDPPTLVPPPVAVVPEPATWAFMIMGFGLVGSVLRRSRRRKAAPASAN